MLGLLTSLIVIAQTSSDNYVREITYLDGQGQNTLTSVTYHGGKELDRMHGLNWYDFGARPYDATLQQWTSIDPKAENYYHLSPYTYCANNPVAFVDPNGEAWRPTICMLPSGLFYYTGFEWVDDEDSYDEEGNLKEGLFEQAILFSDNGSFVRLTDERGKEFNIGSSTAYVYLKDGTMVRFNACTIPSREGYPTIPEKLVEATFGMHRGKYEALRMHDFGDRNSRIDLGFANPAHPNVY